MARIYKNPETPINPDKDESELRKLSMSIKDILDSGRDEAVIRNRISEIIAQPAMTERIPTENIMKHFSGLYKDTDFKNYSIEYVPQEKGSNILITKAQSPTGQRTVEKQPPADNLQKTGLLTPGDPGLLRRAFTGARKTQRVWR